MEQGESSTQSGGEEEEKSGEEKKKCGEDEKEKKKGGVDEKKESEPVDGEEEEEISEQCDTEVKENRDDGLEICDNCDNCEEEEEEEEESSCEEESECFTRRDVSVQVLLNCTRLIPLYSSRVSINRTLHIIIMPSQVGD